MTSESQCARTQNFEPSVAIILPTYCEAENIQSLIREIAELEGSFNTMIVVIDDSSPDGTSTLVRELQQVYDNVLLLVRPQKLGLGTAIISAFRSILSLENQPDYIITMDADYSHNPQDIPKLIHAARSGYDLVIGSRHCEGGKIVGWHRLRRLISHVANLITSAIIGTRIRDCTSGLRCYSNRYVKSVLPNLHCQTYEIQIETVKQARLQGFRVKEIPITFMNRKRGKSKLTRYEFWGFLSYLIRSKTVDRECFSDVIEYKMVRENCDNDKNVRVMTEKLSILARAIYIDLLRELRARKNKKDKSSNAYVV